MRPPIALVVFLVICATPALAQRGGGGDRVAFDNRSSVKVTVYQRAAAGNYKPYRSLAPGEAFAIPAVEGQIWTVATPAYYRPIEMIKVGASRGWGANRVVVSDRDLAAIGHSRLSMTLSNRTGRAVNLCKVVGGEELEWSSLQRSQSRSYYSYAGREWVVRDRETGEELDRFQVGTRSGTVLLEDERRGRGHGRPDGGGGGGIWGGGDRHDRHDRADHAAVTMVVSNRSSRSVAVLKRTALGSRTVGTIAARRTGRVETEPGDVWRFEDAESLAVLETVTVPKGKREFNVDIASQPRLPVAPTPTVREVTLRFYNDTGERIDVYRKRDGRWKHAKRINEGRYWDIDFVPGEDISVRDPDSGRVLESLRAPQGDRVIRVRGHGDHAHVDDGTSPPDRREPEPVAADEPGRGGPPRPRDVLRHIFGR